MKTKKNNIKAGGAGKILLKKIEEGNAETPSQWHDRKFGVEGNKKVTTKKNTNDTEEVVKYKFRKLKANIVKLLTLKGIDDYDINLIDELVFNFKLIDKVKADLLSGNYMKNVRKDDEFPLLQVTPQMSVYKDCLKNIITISTKLAITPLERNKLGIPTNSNKDDDGFNKD